MAISICFVCLGNICRSPTAEGVMRELVKKAGLEQSIAVDSAGTASYHTGEPSDSRTIAHAKKRGIALTHLARTFVTGDFSRFDYVVAMDASNRRNIEHLANDAAARAKISMLRTFEAGAPKGEPRDVPDPYYGGAAGFEEVLDICERACAGLLEHVRREHGL